MQSWHPATARIPPCEGDGLVMQAIEGVLARQPQVVPAWGSSAAPPDATVSGSLRMVFVIGGRNRMRLPQGEAVVETVLRPWTCVAVSRRAWNQPLHRHPHEFLTVDIGGQRIRFYRRRHAGGSLDRDLHTASFVLRPPSEATLRLAAALEALLAEVGAEAERVHLALALLGQCRRELARPALPADATWLQLSEWLRERLHRPISRRQAAAAIGVHPNHVSRLVTRHAGIGFAAWLTARRLELAQELLRGGDPVAAVAERCGFSSAAYFTAVFRRAVGTSPGRWRSAPAAG